MSVKNYVPNRRALEVRWSRVAELFRELTANPLTLLGMVIIAAFLVLAFVTPELVPAAGKNPYQMPRDWSAARQPPLTPGHPLGTSTNGGDVLYGILWGARLSIALSIAVVVSTTVIGVVVGGIAGFVGGWVDELLMRVTDGMLALPAMIWAIAIVSALGPSYRNIAIALITMLWGTYARLIRSEVIHVKGEDYVDAARTIGVSNTSLFIKDVLPNATPPIFVQSTLYFGRVVLIAASLAFIGLAESGIVDWGQMISMGQSGLLAGRWWMSVFPGIAIFLWAFGWNMIGDGLREVFDPESTE